MYTHLTVAIIVAMLQLYVFSSEAAPHNQSARQRFAVNPLKSLHRGHYRHWLHHKNHFEGCSHGHHHENWDIDEPRPHAPHWHHHFASDSDQFSDEDVKREQITSTTIRTRTRTTTAATTTATAAAATTTVDPLRAQVEAVFGQRGTPNAGAGVETQQTTTQPTQQAANGDQGAITPILEGTIPAAANGESTTVLPSTMNGIDLRMGA